MSNLVTGKVRFSYPHVFEPSALNGEDKKYSVTLLIPKTDNVTYQKIMNEINKVTQESVSSVFGGVMPANLALPIYDGDGPRPNGEQYGAECKGHWVLPTKSNRAPEVVDVNCNPILSKNEFYAGCYGRASINFFAYNKNGNKGISCGLGNVQKLEEGQPLDGRTTAAEDFGTPLQQSTPQMQYQAPQYQQPNAYQSPTVPQYQIPTQPNNPSIIGQIDPITGQPMSQPNNIIGNIYGVN